MRKIFIAGFMLSGFLSSVSYSQDLNSKFEAEKFISQSGDTLNYRIFIPDQPDSTGSLPLVLFLHGAGERGSDNKAQLTWGVWRFVADSVQQDHPAIVLAPQTRKGTYWGESNWRTTAMELPEVPAKPLRLTMALLEQLQQNYPVDTTRIYITGLSMGGFGTWNLITRYPNKFAAAVPVCGGGDVTKAHRLAGMPIWNFHGAVDKVVSPRLSRKMITAIRYAGGNPGYTEYPDVGHASWIWAYREPWLVDWMFSKSTQTD